MNDLNGHSTLLVHNSTSTLSTGELPALEQVSFLCGEPRDLSLTCGSVGRSPHSEAAPRVKDLARAGLRRVGASHTLTMRRSKRRAAFSLLEVMIGIVILGLGMVMVATIFPVAWSRARTLSEYTSQRVVTAAASATVKSLVRVSGPGASGSGSIGTSFLGDVLYDHVNDLSAVICDWQDQEWPEDKWDRVHALHVENMTVSTRQVIPEDLWKVEDQDVQTPGQKLRRLFRQMEGEPIVEDSYYRPQVAFHERVYPPMEPLRVGTAADEEDRWHDALATRRFCWAAFYRLRTDIDFDPDASMGPVDRGGLGVTRTFDFYYVTLRRPQATYRYAPQDPDSASNPCELTSTPVEPAATSSNSDDVMFPIPWRVQVQFPNTLVFADNATGVPTEILVPPTGAASDVAKQFMLAQMFPAKAWFIDEVSGNVYRVVKRRVTGDHDEQAFLTLDREVFIEDLDLPNGYPPYPQNHPGVLDDEELLRTVWVFPPSVQPRDAGDDILVFEGSQPVVDIKVQTRHIHPTE